ncbi:hypothetical protein HDF19_09955 [Mucilaginibacter sp. E4BP6]|uniref:hypothetical protein n=1 Tax=Mucilaginibacter sp. E4BP6 TaxID=2723089 RepID=UPI0015C6E0FD|nr:hypothetical protein [Mucilaginibacter sp. E4BP6]NYE67798.1 hypothetical protein [Mucilaginibacter sp. E4BP6]
MNFKETISELENMLFALNPKARGYYEAIEALRNVGIKDYGEIKAEAPDFSKFKVVYDPNTNMRNKTLFAIRALNRFVKNKEIAKYLHEQEPNVPIKDFVTALSNPLFFLKNEKRIHKISVGTGNNGVYWGSLKWINEDGSIKAEHKYIEEPKQPEIDI